MNAKAKESAEARYAKESLEKIQIELTKSQFKNASLLKQYEREQDKVKERNIEINELTNTKRRLDVKIQDMNRKLDVLNKQLEKKRFKKRQYKLQVEHLTEQVEETDENYAEVYKKLEETRNNMQNG